MWALLQIFWRVSQWKNYENRPTSDETIAKVKRGRRFLRHSVYLMQTLEVWTKYTAQLRYESLKSLTSKNISFQLVTAYWNDLHSELERWCSFYLEHTGFHLTIELMWPPNSSDSVQSTMRSGDCGVFSDAIPHQDSRRRRRPLEAASGWRAALLHFSQDIIDQAVRQGILFIESHCRKYMMSTWEMDEIIFPKNYELQQIICTNQTN